MLHPVFTCKITVSPFKINHRLTTDFERRNGDFTCKNMMLHDASVFFATRDSLRNVSILVQHKKQFLLY
jgi:hypothetical protein